MGSSAARKARRQQAAPADEAPPPPEPEKKRKRAVEEKPPEKKKARQAKADFAPPPAASVPLGNAWDEEEEEEADEPQQGDAPAAKRAGREKVSCTLFVGQLPYSASATDIKRHLKAGGVGGKIAVRLLTRRDGGGSRGLAFVELASEADVHTALRLHRSPMDGRRINVERTVGGGGSKAESRRTKLSELRKVQGNQMRRQVEQMIQAILPEASGGEGGGEDAAADEAGGEGGYGGSAPVCRADVDDRVLEFLQTVPVDIADGALREAKALGMGGIRNRPAYLMGMLKRKVAEADKVRIERERERQQRKGGGAKGGAAGKAKAKDGVQKTGTAVGKKTRF